MSRVLPRLRPGLDFMPSPLSGHPGLMVRDSFQYTDTVLVIPPVLVGALAAFDGEQTDRDVQESITQQIGQIMPVEAIHNLIDTLQRGGFLETPEYFEMRDRKHAEFRAAGVRVAAHAGASYPEGEPAARTALDKYFAEAVAEKGPGAPGPVGIAAPHVSPDGGWNSYVSAYRRITPDLAGRTFVILGTSHYGEPEKFGVTRKPYATPFGAVETATDLVDWLAKRAPDAIIEEDYCHAVEHSIEFQALFLRYRVGAPVRVLPLLCGPFADSLMNGRPPESQESVKAFLDALGELQALHGQNLVWLLGVDMAHMGARYGDDLRAQAHRGEMAEVEQEDHERIERMCAGDAAGFFERVHPGGDRLKWCGYSPIYTFLRAVPQARGALLHYEQWNIDPQSVVSFAGIEFRVE